MGVKYRQLLLAITLMMGVLTVVALAATLEPAGRTFAALAGPVQSIMSITVPFLGVVMVRDQGGIAPKVVAAAVLAAGVGAFGDVLCVGALLLAPSTAADPWAHAGTIAVGSVLVQIVAMLVGTGFGMLMRSIVVAIPATIVVPLGVWFLFRAVWG